MRLTPAALRDALAACITAGRCALCGIALVDEAIWQAETVWCVACAFVHGAPSRAHCVWRPEAARRVRATNAPDVEGGP